MGSAITTLLIATLALPLALIITELPRLSKKKLLSGLATCYALFVVDESVFLWVGKPYYFYHVLAGCVLVSVSAAITCVLEQRAEDSRPPLVHFAALELLILVGCSAVLYARPGSLGAVSFLAILLTLVQVVVLLIRSIDDNAIPYFLFALLWAVRSVVSYQSWPVMETVLSASLFVVIAGAIVLRVRRSNAEMISEKELLVKERNAVVNMLSDISSSAQSLSSLEFTLLRVQEAILEALDAEGAATYTCDDAAGNDVRIRYAGSTGVFWTMQMHGEHIAGKTTFLTTDLKRESYPMGEGVVGIVARSAQALILDRGHARSEMRSLGLNPHNIRNLLAVPLKVKQNVLGVLVVQNRRNKSSFSPDDMRVLDALADQAAFSINNARMYAELARTDRIRQEMNIASDIQRQLLPKSVPAMANLSIFPFIKPAKEVGGDYYDFIERGDGGMGLVIGDVSGKGLPAGMVMVIARTTLQIVARGHRAAKDVMVEFSKEMYPRMRRGQFMTMNYLLWDDSERVLRYSGAGHEHILWYRSERKVSERIRAGGIAVGLLEDPGAFLSEETLNMKSGDVFVLYTDGITEARNAKEEMFTLARLQESLDRYAPAANAETVGRGIIADVSAFTGDADQYDDMTLLVASVS